MARAATGSEEYRGHQLSVSAPGRYNPVSVETLAGLESSRVRLAHVDLDLYQPILDCCDFIYPRLVPGGMMVFDDYGVPSCPGARAAVDFFFLRRPETPFPLISGQCLVTRLGASRPELEDDEVGAGHQRPPSRVLSDGERGRRSRVPALIKGHGRLPQEIRG